MRDVTQEGLRGLALRRLSVEQRPPPLDSSGGGGGDAAAEAADFGRSGALARAAQAEAGAGADAEYVEPADACRPAAGWRLHAFKGEEALPPLLLQGRAHFLVGRAAGADLRTLHPSCSGRHAVLQFRRVQDAHGERHVRPYLLDLRSTNGTRVNGRRLPPARYVQLLPRDVLCFGHSSRDYVLLHERLLDDA